MITIDPDALACVRLRGLSRGLHSTPEEGFCVVEAAALLRKAAFNDKLPCVSPVIRAFVIHMNDAPCFSKFRDDLIDYIDPHSGKPVIFNTAGNRALDRQRSYAVADWAVRTVLPIAMEAIGKTEEAAELRELPMIVDQNTARAARETARRTQKAADAAAYAAAYSADAADTAAYAAYTAATYAAYAADAAYTADSAYAADAAYSADSAYAAYAAAAVAAVVAAEAAGDAVAACRQSAGALDPRALWDESLRMLEVLIVLKPALNE